MAITYSLIFEGKALTIQMIFDALRDSGYPCNKSNKHDSCIEIDCFIKKLGYTLYLTESGKPPYDAYDFKFLSKEFKYGKQLDFRFLNNFDDYDIRFQTMLSIVFSLISKIRENVLLVINGDTLLGFFSKDSKIYINNKYGTWDNKYFSEMIQNKEFLEFSDTPLDL